MHPDPTHLSSVKAMPDADETASEAQLLARALRSITQRLVKLEAEQKALDANMLHIANALEAIVEAAAAKLEIKA